MTATLVEEIEWQDCTNLSCRVRIGQPFIEQVPAERLVNVTLAYTVPAAPSPSLKRPENALP